MDKTFKYLICVTVGVVVVKLQLYIEFKAKYIGIKYQIVGLREKCLRHNNKRK